MAGIRPTLAARRPDTVRRGPWALRAGLGHAAATPRACRAGSGVTGTSFSAAAGGP